MIDFWTVGRLEVDLASIPNQVPPQYISDFIGLQYIILDSAISSDSSHFCHALGSSHFCLNSSDSHTVRFLYNDTLLRYYRHLISRDSRAAQ
jgi:hypothetical protein